MHYSIIVQGSPNNGTFQWINPYKFKNPFITSMSVLFKPTQGQAMFNNVDSMNVVTNTNGESLTIDPDSIECYISCENHFLSVHFRPGQHMMTIGNMLSEIARLN